jgi:hypothetical protein
MKRGTGRAALRLHGASLTARQHKPVHEHQTPRSAMISAAVIRCDQKETSFGASKRDQLWSINMRNVTNRQHRRSQAQFDKPTKRQKTTRVQAPWPDQKARQEMSNAEVRLDLGKHSKNRDWQAKW